MERYRKVDCHMDTDKNSVLIIDDEVINIKALMLILKKDYIVYAERDGKSSLEAAKKLQPDLILLDIMIPDIDGFEIIKNLKADKETEDIPVIFITSLSNPESEVQGFSLGAVDYIHKPFIAPIVKMRVQSQMKIVNLLRKVQSLSVTDFLTGIGNRRYLNIQLGQEWERAKRQQSTLGFIIMDIDDFKNFNDSYGHLHGDTVLQNVACAIESVVTRSTDKVARWGGEEFAVILPDTELSGVKKVAEDIRSAVERSTLLLDDKSTVMFTVSIGIHSVVPDYEGKYTLNNFVSDADKAMYNAKKNGKNRVCMV